MTESLGTLLQGSWSYCKSVKKPVLIASLIFGVLLFGMQTVISQKTNDTIEQRFGDIDQMQELVERIEAGDEAALQEMMMQMGMMGEGGEIDPEKMEDIAIEMMGSVLPLFGAFFFGMMLLTLVSSVFYLVLALEGSQDVIVTARKVPSLILPLLGVWIWSFLRSFAWIPFIGVILAIIIGPRFVMSSVILVKEQKGVMESVRLSYERSRGYWGKIVGNCIVSALVVMIAVMVLSIAIGMIGTMSMVAAGIAGATLQSASTAFATIFIVRLSNTIMSNPLAVVTSK